MSQHAVIVGAGAIGLATAYRLARDGAEVTVLDADPPGTGTSAKNAGWIVPIMSTPVPAPGMVGQSLRWMLRKDSPLYVRPTLRPEHVRFMTSMLRHCTSKDFDHGVEVLATLNERTVSLFDEYQHDGVQFEYHRTGHLLVFTTDKTMQSYRSAMGPIERIGHTAVPLSGDEVRDLEPTITSEVRWGLQCPDERFLDPFTLLAGLAERCRALGVTILHDRRVTSIRMTGTSATAVHAGPDEFEADVLILAAGVGTAALARSVGCPLPIQPGKGYGVDYPDSETKLRHAIYLGEAKVAVTPLADRLRLSGTMEFGSTGMDIDANRLRGITNSASRYLTELPAGEPRAWAGLRPMTPDGLPVIGALPGTDNVLVASGHAMLGITLAPVTADLIAAHARTGAASPELANLAEAFSPARLAPRRRRTRREGRTITAHGS